MKKTSNTYTGRWGFSLAEVLAALVISAMVLVTVISIYSRAETAAAAIKRRFDDSRLPSEVLQRIAEDLDRIIVSDATTKITINNKFDNGYPTAQLSILKNIVDAQNQTRIFEHIIWQTSYDYDANSLVLYRQRISEVGLLEDKLLDEEREAWEQGLFVPICAGITYFQVRAVKDGEPIDRWSGQMPPGLEVTISFAVPFQTLENTLDVPDELKFTRAIAIGRAKTPKFKITPKEQDESGGVGDIAGESETGSESLGGLPGELEGISEGLSGLPRELERANEGLRGLPRELETGSSRMRNLPKK